MPNYSYLCKECNCKTEKVVEYKDRDDPKQAPLCKKCGKPTKYVFDFAPCGNIRIFNGVI